jgi:hypothetical protein
VSPVNENQTPPTFEELVSLCRGEFAFLTPLGFVEVPLPDRPFTNPFQVRFSNGKLTVVIEGINWGQAAMTHFEDAAGVQVPDILFVPHDQRPKPSKRRKSDQRSEICTAAARIQQFCIPVLTGDMASFYDCAAEWQRITGRAHPKQPRRLP